MEQIKQLFDDKLAELATEYDPQNDTYPNLEWCFELLLADVDDSTYEEAISWFKANESKIEQRFDNLSAQAIKDGEEWAETKRYLTTTYGLY